MNVNSLLAAKKFEVHQENIIVANGAAELIKSLMRCLTGTVGFIRPTFEEYLNRYSKENSVVYIPDNRDYAYTSADLKSFFNNKNIQCLIIINPDNPSGNYIPKKELLELVGWAKEKKIKIVIDESFVDFADADNPSIISQCILDANPHLYIMKSISKSFGVPGLRLGILASGDTTMIDYMKKDVAIWNINSFAEFYLQIEEKYRDDYEAALKKTREERKRFEAELSKIRGVRVIPSQANYIMVELDEDICMQELLKNLLLKYDLLIKELATKTEGKNYLRLAVRNTDDNNRLIQAFKAELES